MKNRFLAVAALVFALLLAGCASSSAQQAPADGGQNAPVSADAGTAEDGQGADVVPIPDISGGWVDYVSKRAGLYVAGIDDGVYTFTVHWSSSASEYTEWESTASYNEQTGEYEYTGGIKREVAYDEDEEVIGEPTINELYNDSTGSFALLGDRIVWNDSKDQETAAGRVFIRDENDVPDDLALLGFYMAEDESTLEIEYVNGITADMSIIRLSQFAGSAVYNPEEKALIADVTDPNGNPMELKISKNGDDSVTVVVASSTWELLPEGETFVFR